MGLARRLRMSRERIRRWQRNGWLITRQDDDGHHVIWADGNELRRLRELGRCLDAGGDAPLLEQLKKPTKNPVRNGRGSESKR